MFVHQLYQILTCKSLFQEYSGTGNKSPLPDSCIAMLPFPKSSWFRKIILTGMHSSACCISQVAFFCWILAQWWWGKLKKNRRGWLFTTSSLICPEKWVLFPAGTAQTFSVWLFLQRKHTQPSVLSHSPLPSKTDWNVLTTPCGNAMQWCVCSSLCWLPPVPVLRLICVTKGGTTRENEVAAHWRVLLIFPKPNCRNSFPG